MCVIIRENSLGNLTFQCLCDSCKVSCMVSVDCYEWGVGSGNALKLENPWSLNVHSAVLK